jgi:hypothetical protein
MLRQRKKEKWTIYDCVKIEGIVCVGYNLTLSCACCNDVGHKYQYRHESIRHDRIYEEKDNDQLDSFFLF